MPIWMFREIKMKKRIIIAVVAVVVVAVGIVIAVVINNNRPKESDINPANPATDLERRPSFGGTLTVSNEKASAGDEVQVKVSVKDNPGILGMTLNVNYYTNILTLIDAKSGDAVKDVLTFTKPGKYQNNCSFLWDGMELSNDQIKDGDVLILTFKVSDDAEPGDYPILLSYEKDAIVDNNLNIVELEIIDGGVTIE